MMHRPVPTVLILIALASLFVCAITGAMAGLRMTAGHGLPLRVLGAMAGFAAYFILIPAAMTAVLLTQDLFWRWWRPYPPPCESGTCRRWRDYKTEYAPEAERRIEGLSPVRWTCSCGHVYAAGVNNGLERCWFRVLPGGEIRLYLRHGYAGRWQQDRQTPV